MNTHIRTLAEAGAHFVLCKSDKRPIEKWKDKRPDAARVREWKKKDNGNLIGIVPATVGLLVVDIDKNVDRAREIIVQSRAPLSEADTRKGKHLFYPKAKSRTGNAKWEYGDIRQDNGYVVMWDAGAIVEAIGKLPGEPFNLDHLPGSRDATVEPGEEDKGGRNNRLWGATFRAGLIGDGKARTNAEKWAKVAGLSDKEIDITAEKGWTTGHAARVNKILPSMDATCLEAALTLMNIDYRFNSRSMSPRSTCPTATAS